MHVTQKLKLLASGGRRPPGGPVVNRFHATVHTSALFLCVSLQLLRFLMRHFRRTAAVQCETRNPDRATWWRWEQPRGALVETCARRSGAEASGNLPVSADAHCRDAACDRAVVVCPQLSCHTPAASHSSAASARARHLLAGKVASWTRQLSTEGAEPESDCSRSGPPSPPNNKQ